MSIRYEWTCEHCGGVFNNYDMEYETKDDKCVCEECIEELEGEEE